MRKQLGWFLSVLPLIPLLLASCGGGGGGEAQPLTGDRAAEWTVRFVQGVEDIGGLIEFSFGTLEGMAAGGIKGARWPVSSIGGVRQASCQPNVQVSNQDSDNDGTPDWIVVDFGQEGCTVQTEDGTTLTVKNGVKFEDMGDRIRVSYNPSELGGRKLTISGDIDGGQATVSVSGSLETSASTQGNQEISQVTFSNLTMTWQGARTGTFSWNGSVTHTSVDADQDGSFDDPGTEEYLRLSNLTYTVNGSSVTYNTPENDPPKWVVGTCDYPVDGTLEITTPAGTASVDFGTPSDCGRATVYIGGGPVGVVDLATGQFAAGV